jgi:hypothetical protein
MKVQEFAVANAQYSCFQWLRTAFKLPLGEAMNLWALPFFVTHGTFDHDKEEYDASFQ